MYPIIKSVMADNHKTEKVTPDDQYHPLFQIYELGLSTSKCITSIGFPLDCDLSVFTKMVT